MRSPISLKSYTYTEGAHIDVADINGKAVAHYSGRSRALPQAIFIER